MDDKNRLTLNYSKSNYISLSKNVFKTAHFKLQIKQNIILQTNKLKYLGVTVDNTLSRQPHFDKISKNASQQNFGQFVLIIIFQYFSCVSGC